MYVSFAPSSLELAEPFRVTSSPMVTSVLFADRRATGAAGPVFTGVTVGSGVAIGGGLPPTWHVTGSLSTTAPAVSTTNTNL